MRNAICLITAVLSTAGVAGHACQSGIDPSSTTDSRFERHDDGTVTDTDTKLMWMRCSGGQIWSREACTGAPSTYTVDGAHQLAEQVNEAGDFFFNDWRVPSIRELATIAELGCNDPRIDLAVFPNTPADFYWSRNARAGTTESGRGYALSFGAEGVAFPSQSETHHVRLVRHAF